MISVHPNALADRYLASLEVEFPGLRLVQKNTDRFSVLVGRLLRVLTVGGQSSYLTQYVTTIGRTIYLPSSWESRPDGDRYITLRHEAVHLRQFRRFGLLGMSLLYLLPILPMGLSLGRALLEWEAYRETIRATAEVRGAAAAASPELEAHIVRQFVSGAYGYMWPFPWTVRRWIQAEVRRIDGPA